MGSKDRVEEPTSWTAAAFVADDVGFGGAATTRCFLVASRARLVMAKDGGEVILVDA